jgi:hypothetical protein
MTLVARLEFFAAMVKANAFTRSALVVSFCLLYRHLNGRTGRCDPSTAALAEETGLTVRGIEKAIAELRESGWWKINQGGGRGHRNSYMPRLEMVNAGSGFRAGKAEQPFGDLPPETPNHRSRNPEPPFGGTNKNRESDFHTFDVHANRPGTAARSRPRDPSVEDSDCANSEFENFWQIYPHRGSFSDPKKPARLKFEAAVKRGVDPREILAGAERHRAHVQRYLTEPNFRPQAKTWLNEERWTQPHEPEPVRPRVGMN